MARGPRKTIEEKITEKEEVIFGLRGRIKAEQNELDALYREKRDRDMECLSDLLQASGMKMEEAAEVLQDYILSKTEEQSA